MEEERGEEERERESWWCEKTGSLFSLFFFLLKFSDSFFLLFIV